MTVETLRLYGTRPVTVQCAYGTFTGSIVQHSLTDESVLVLLAEDCDDARQVAIDVNDITRVMER